jgi:UDP-N-acetyl-D-mannosaminuronic acid dehydrogenase
MLAKIKCLRCHIEGMEDICVLGLGYIGLPTALMFAKAGYMVHGVDIKEEIVTTLAAGKLHIKEPGLEELLNEILGMGNITFDVKPITADVFIICVPTPLNSEKKANLDYVQSAVESMISYLKDGSLVVLESTVPPRTCVEFVQPILERSGFSAGNAIHLAFCPERTIPGKILDEIVNNDRIVGGVDEESTKLARNYYSSFVKGQIHETDATTAEMVKLMENTFRDVNIALANEFAMVAETVKINVWEAIMLANKHPRVNIHQPGPGVGGHCIPIVPWFIVEKDVDHTPLIQCARMINDEQPAKIVSLLKKVVDLAQSPAITVWGVAFKPNTDDASYSPASDIIRLIEREGGRVQVSDPFVERFEYPIQTLEESLDQSECIIVIADHDMYATLDPEEIGNHMKNRVIFDTRNSLSRKKWEDAGFNVLTFGDCSTYS